tara:strand:+ start:4519 stop:4629 length:111 start_codon:yes stop_codon:yes gene_type:complete
MKIFKELDNVWFCNGKKFLTEEEAKKYKEKLLKEKK